MVVETTKLSSKGQIVIPRDIREKLGVEEGSVFAVVGSKDTVILKRIKTPSKSMLMKELQAIAQKGKKRLQSKGIGQSDFVDIVHDARKRKT